MSWYLGYVLFYLVILFSIGIYYFFKIKTADEYLIANWNMGFWSIVGTIISTWCGASVFIGWVGMGFTVGLSGYFKFAFPAALVSIAVMYFFAGILRRQRLYTMADLFNERFGSRAGIIPSVFSAFIYSVPTLALQFVGMSTVFTIIFDIEKTYGILISFVLILTFTILGGLPGTIVTDAIQSIVIILGIILLVVVSILYGGGIQHICNVTDAKYISPLGPYGIKEILLYALSVGPFYLVWQSTWQRMFASKSETVAKKAGITGFAIAAIVSIIPFVVGMIARTYVPLDLDPDYVFTYVTVQLMSPWVGGLVIVALFAALLTSADSFILQGSSNLTVDIYQRLINPNADSKKMMLVSRLTVIIISVLGLLVALNLKDIISMYQWALRLSGTVLVFPFLAVMFWKRATKIAVMSSMVLSFIATISWPYLGLSIDHSLFGFSVSLVSLILISVLTKHSSDEQVKAVYRETLNSSLRKNNQTGNV